MFKKNCSEHRLKHNSQSNKNPGNFYAQRSKQNTSTKGWRIAI